METLSVEEPCLHPAKQLVEDPETHELCCLDCKLVLNGDMLNATRDKETELHGYQPAPSALYERAGTDLVAATGAILGQQWIKSQKQIRNMPGATSLESARERRNIIRDNAVVGVAAKNYVRYTMSDGSFDEVLNTFKEILCKHIEKFPGLSRHSEDQQAMVERATLVLTSMLPRFCLRLLSLPLPEVIEELERMVEDDADAVGLQLVRKSAKVANEKSYRQIA